MRHPEVTMFSTEQVNQFQARLHDVIQQAQTRATARAKEIEAASRKVLETLGDKAQIELKQLLSQAKVDTREQVERFGAELEKLGKKIQAMARAAGQAAEANGAASSGVQPPAA
jgi:methyl-accepting chemotaxis protein